MHELNFDGTKYEFGDVDVYTLAATLKAFHELAAAGDVHELRKKIHRVLNAANAGKKPGGYNRAFVKAAAFLDPNQIDVLLGGATDVYTKLTTSDPIIKAHVDSAIADNIANGHTGGTFEDPIWQAASFVNSAFNQIETLAPDATSNHLAIKHEKLYRFMSHFVKSAPANEAADRIAYLAAKAAGATTGATPGATAGATPGATFTPAYDKAAAVAAATKVIAEKIAAEAEAKAAAETKAAALKANFMAC